MRIEVCAAGPDGATRIAVDLPSGSRVADAIAASDIVARAGLDRGRLSFGVFGRRLALDAPLVDGDRVEVYRPLIIEPMDARRRRAEVAKRGRGG